VRTDGIGPSDFWLRRVVVVGGVTLGVASCAPSSSATTPPPAPSIDGASPTAYTDGGGDAPVKPLADSPGDGSFARTSSKDAAARNAAAATRAVHDASCAQCRRPACRPCPEGRDLRNILRVPSSEPGVSTPMCVGVGLLCSPARGGHGRRNRSLPSAMPPLPPELDTADRGMLEQRMPMGTRPVTPERGQPRTLDVLAIRATRRPAGRLGPSGSRNDACWAVCHD
jgi:hypothetical protein